MNNSKDETIAMIPKRFEQGEIISKDNPRHLLGLFFVTVGFALAIFVLFHLFFDSKSIHHFYLLYVGVGALVSFLLGFFIMLKSE
jgi:hypothetical protein